MIEISVWAMVIALMYRSTNCSPDRLYAGAIFVSASCVHLYFSDDFSDMGGIYPYFIASIFDLAIVSTIAKLRTISPSVISILRICIAETALNGIGWLMWDNEVTNYDTIYAGAFLMLSIYTVYILGRKDKADDKRGFKVDSWGYLLRANIGPYSGITQRSGE